MTQVSHDTPELCTLAVDCGGGGIKVCILDSSGHVIGHARRTPVAYPFSPENLVKIISDYVSKEDNTTFHRMTVGMPGMIRHGICVYTPHYIREHGPHTRLNPAMQEGWTGLNVQQLMEDSFGVPSLVMNDAEVAAAGTVSGEGLELVLTFGTGLGSAVVDNGVFSPHMEFSHAPFKWGLTFDDVIGELERVRLGDVAWSRRVLKAVNSLFPVIRWDKLYIGGGNAAYIPESVRPRFLGDVEFIPNAAGLSGGVRIWDMVR
ncbi:ROK family protein [Actinotignum urinale]|uniref:ROK family protein n=1 Tax=Actinotignum urinale TaxID=190146 RepID=UPI002A7ED066|nr:ROK family protein [Actinotignum urinale]MDY5129047.1 ROK family protein [Actinotignum urinale]